MRKLLTILLASFALGCATLHTPAPTKQAPVLVLTPEATASIDSLWNVAAQDRKEGIACFELGTYEILWSDTGISYAIVLGPMTPALHIAYRDSATVKPDSGVTSFCKTLGVDVHTHFLDAPFDRWHPSVVDIVSTAGTPAPFALLVSAPDSIVLYAAKRSVMWQP